MLEIVNHVVLNSDSVHNGAWHKCPDDCFYIKPLILLHGKTLGILGYGNIEKRVGRIAEVLGMRIISYSKNPEATTKADVLSLHCHLTLENRQFINAKFISKMKDGAILLNSSRRALVDQFALLAALKSSKITAAGLDVLRAEPPKISESSPLIGTPNCFITPHHAWMTVETRRPLIDIAYQNIQSFINGDKVNRVDV